jgi:hypothetical protein
MPSELITSTQGGVTLGPRCAIIWPNLHLYQRQSKVAPLHSFAPPPLNPVRRRLQSSAASCILVPRQFRGASATLGSPPWPMMMIPIGNHADPPPLSVSFHISVIFLIDAQPRRFVYLGFGRFNVSLHNRK